MGTNYYAIPKATDDLKGKIIEKVNEGNFESAKDLMPEKIHIGKSSVGWQFMFNHNDWEYFNQSRDYLELFLEGCIITNEYSEEISYDAFWEMVEMKKDAKFDHQYCSEYFGLQFSNYIDFS
jgi:hypothetical protein